MNLKHQPYLGIEFAPPKVQAHGLREAHTRPYVSQGKGTPMFRVHPSKAWGYAQIELRTGNSWPCLLFDIDHPHALEHLAGLFHDGLIPLTNWVTERTANGHAHAAFTLARPVLHGAGMQEAPIQAFGRVGEYLARTMGADAGYNGVLTHNPMAPDGAGLHTVWQETRPYTLKDLTGYIPRGWRVPRNEPPITEGYRNCQMFRAAMQWAGRSVGAIHKVVHRPLFTEQDGSVHRTTQDDRDLSRRPKAKVPLESHPVSTEEFGGGQNSPASVKQPTAHELEAEDQRLKARALAALRALDA